METIYDSAEEAGKRERARKAEEKAGQQEVFLTPELSPS